MIIPACHRSSTELGTSSESCGPVRRRRCHRTPSPATSWQPSPASPEPTADRCGARIDDTLDKDVKRLVERSTAAQGLSFHVQDPTILARVAALVNAVRNKEAARGMFRSRPTNLADRQLR
jgi:hypothetical protein